jgi:hypothetical protein
LHSASGRPASIGRIAAIAQVKDMMGITAMLSELARPGNREITNDTGLNSKTRRLTPLAEPLENRS